MSFTVLTCVEFEVLMLGTVEMIVFWDVPVCSLVDRHITSSVEEYASKIFRVDDKKKDSFL
jgi:hypothetical protein